jgi:hypothetical protein
MDPADVPPYEEAVAAVRAGLGNAFDVACSAGQTMTADEIVAFA